MLLDADALAWSLRSCTRSRPLRPLLEETARAGDTTSWPLIRKHTPNLPRLHRDDEYIILWLVDEDRQEGEPLLSSLLTVRDPRMHSRFPAIAKQLGPSTGHASAQQRTAWSCDVLKVHQHWR
ncbi:hypothetical protein ACFU8W_50480 [Streptomyces sp. NPDC057565]|uniref:hypothetical protein n=1 Tax=Streptomyces sp. NPDC057565 TaxID=3346169 RepID=UPI0036A75815